MADTLVEWEGRKMKKRKRERFSTIGSKRIQLSRSPLTWSPHVIHLISWQGMERLCTGSFSFSPSLFILPFFSIFWIFFHRPIVAKQVERSVVVGRWWRKKSFFSLLQVSVSWSMVLFHLSLSGTFYLSLCLFGTLYLFFLFDTIKVVLTHRYPWN